MRAIEFIVPYRPVSLQARDRGNLQAWKTLVAAYARMVWPHAPIVDHDVNVSIVFLCDPRAPIDVDNIIKPIQDALTSVVYSDDVIVTDADSHRRFLGDYVDIAHCSKALIEMLTSDIEAVYVRVRNARRVGKHL